MEYSSKTLEQLVEAFSRLPGIGRKSAQRIALYLLREGKNEAEHLAKAIVEMIEKIGNCSICFNLTEEEKLQIIEALENPFRIVDFGLAPAEPLILKDIFYDFDFEYDKRQLNKLNFFKKTVIPKKFVTHNY